MIAKETVDEINKRVSIIDLISQYAEVKKRGSSYVACCPFHNEKTPSFHISPEKGLYHCFGCGASGNLFSFIMNIENLTFIDAVKEIASKFNIEVKYTTQKFNDNRKDIDGLYKVNALALKFFKSSLKTNYKVLYPYLKERGFTDKILKDFYIGFSPNSWNALYDFLKSSKVPEKLLELSGLFSKNSKGEFFDVFRNRLIFPILISSNKVAGFGGRVIPQITPKEDLDKYPKYLNSKETLVYEKSKILYNFYKAKDSIKREKCCFLVEGYMDVIGLSKVGINNTVATCGTSLTFEHAKKLEALGCEVIVMFDADNAGYNAASRAFEIFLNTKVSTKAIFLPKGEDPDSIAKIKGQDTFKFLKSLKSISLLEAFILKQLRDENLESIKDASPNIKEKICDKTIESISKINSEIVLIEMLKDASFLLQTPLSALKDNLSKYRNNISNLNFNSVKKADENKNFVLPPIDKEVVRIVFSDNTLLQNILSNSLFCENLTSTTLEFLTMFFDIQSNFNKGQNEDNYQKDLKNLLKSYKDLYLNIWMEVKKKKYQFDAQNALNECEKAINKIKTNNLIKELENEIELERDEQKSVILVKKLVEIKKKL